MLVHARSGLYHRSPRGLRTVRAWRAAVAVGGMLSGVAVARSAPAQEAPPAFTPPVHRLSLLVAPLTVGLFSGDFGEDNEPVSDSHFTELPLGLMVSARYGASVARALELGANLEYFRAYGEPSNDGSVNFRINALNATLFIRPYASPSGGRWELGAHGRAGVASGLWGTSVLRPSVAVGGGLDVRHWLNRQWGIGGELSLSRFDIRRGEVTPVRGPYVDAGGANLALELTMTHAL
jgi:hypothetical protein